MAGPMPNPVQVMCPTCREYQSVTANVITNDDASVVLELDATALREHYTACLAKPVEAKTPKALQSRFTFEDIVPAFIAAGRRTCTGCNAPNAACLRQLEGQRAAVAKGAPHGACCGMCGEGNTHPAVAGDVDCATWGITHGAQH